MFLSIDEEKVIFCYLVINLLISDGILRQSIKLRTNINISHTCDECSTNFIWNLQDSVSYIIFNIIYIMRTHLAPADD